MKKTAIIFFLFNLFCGLILFGQNGQKTNAVDFGSTDLSIGTIQGIHPNLVNSGFGSFVYGDVNQGLKVKGIPFRFVGHLSNEQLRIGQPSFFQFNYDPNSVLNFDKIKSEDLKSVKQTEFEKLESELYKLEGQLSYKKEMLSRFEAERNKLAIPTTGIDTTIALPNLGLGDLKQIEIGEESLPNIEVNSSYQSKVDSILIEINEMSGKLSSIRSKSDSLKNVIDGLGKFNDPNLNQRFKLTRFNLGLTSLSNGGLSRNAIPIHGIHVEGRYRKTFYAFSLGLTQPFRNFSSQVFSQITTNTENVFNLNDFFSSPKMRLVSSSVVGIGEKNKNNLSLEHFYMGKSIEAIRKNNSEPISNTFNTAGNYSIRQIENLEFGYLLGISIVSKDTISAETDLDNIGYKGTLKYKMPKHRSSVEMEYRALGKNYDSNSQGVMINGSTHKMIGYTKKIFNFSTISVRYIEDQFTKTDSIVLFDNSKKLMTQVNMRLNSSNKLQAAYSYIKGSGSEIGSRAGMLSTILFINELKIGKNNLVNNAQFGYTRMPSRVNFQEITSAILTSQYFLNNFIFSLKGSYEKYQGLQQLWGENFILEPQVAYSKQNGEISLSYQYCKSNQFGKDFGLNLRAKFLPSQYLTWQISAQKWLLKERSFFYFQAPSYVAPWYVDIKMIVHLNVKK